MHFLGLPTDPTIAEVRIGRRFGENALHVKWGEDVNGLTSQYLLSLTVSDDASWKEEVMIPAERTSHTFLNVLPRNTGTYQVALKAINPNGESYAPNKSWHQPQLSE